MTSAVLTPVRKSETKPADGGLFRKQLLPVGTVDYKGKKLNFTKDYLAGLAKSYDDKAYDSVKLFFAPDDNAHTVDPERIRGDVTGVEVTDDGLDILVKPANEDAAKVLKENPDLGVSARIVEDLAKGDGRSFPAAIQHVLATVDPVVTGMRPWQAVDLASDEEHTVDLTDAPFIEEKETVVPDAPTLTPEQVKEHLAAMPEADRAAFLADYVPKSEPVATTETGDETLTAEEQAIVDALIKDTEAETAGASLSAEDRAAIDLAHTQAQEALTNNATLRAELARERWTGEAAALLGAGVPKTLIDLAAPWCGGEAPAEFIDLSNSETTVEQVRDAAAADMRKVLEACKGVVDLSVIGSTEAADTSDDPVYDRWVAEHPHV